MRAGALEALRAHWPEYVLEAAQLAVFLVLIGLTLVAFEAPGSPLRVRDAVLARAAAGLGIGAVAVALIYSPSGRRTGPHLNPAVTLAFLRLGKVKPWDACFYVLAQLAGGIAGVAVASAVIGGSFRHPPVRGIVTLPGSRGEAVAFAAEATIAFVLITVVLLIASRPVVARYTGLCAGALLAVFFLVEHPLSGTSLNPARTLAAAIGEREWRALWIYFLAPPLGMLLAAEVHMRLGLAPVPCAKLNDDHRRCIFRCDYHPEEAARS